MPEPRRTGRAVPPPEVRAALAPLLVRPATAAVLTDFDGTISPIVTNPHEARPLEGTGSVLAALARRFAEVAVVSGRSVPFLAEHLGIDLTADPDHRVRLVGLYGLEQSWDGGPITRDPAAAAWQPAIDAAASILRRDAPTGVLVEPKGLAVTVHWRRAPEAEGWVADAVAAQVAQSGLRAHPGRLSVELRPPLDIDKGSVVRNLAGSCSAACYFGDDLGDLPAFAALAAMRSGGIHTVSVAVLDPESDPVVAEAADVSVTGQGEALDALAWLAGAPTGGSASTH